MLSANSPSQVRKSSRFSQETKGKSIENKKAKVESVRIVQSKEQAVKPNLRSSTSRSSNTSSSSSRSNISSLSQSPTRKSSRTKPNEPETTAKIAPVPAISITPATAVSNVTPTVSNTSDPFATAKRAFHRSGSFKIVGRVEEKAELTSFWYDSVAAGKGASIYISGNPGTGKTALVDELIPELAKDFPKTEIIKINCMMLKDPLKCFQEISQSIGIAAEKNSFLAMNSLEKFFCKSKMFYVLIIDEIDQIGMKDPELLCRLLAMPYLENARVSLFGIANSMDLTERFLPRLKLLNCQPSVLHFPQYTVPDITAILSDRLERINSASNELGRPFIDKPAIELTSRKVASTGDLRRALDVLRQSIDLAEDEYKLSTANNTGALVKLSHVLKIMDKFGSSQSGPLVLLKSLNLHQKVILSAIVGFPSGGPVLTIQKLYEEYCTGSTRPPKLYDAVTRSEFIDLISNLESMSLIGKSTESSSNNASNNNNNIADIWKLKVYLLIPNELVKAMISQELPTIKVLFNL